MLVRKHFGGHIPGCGPKSACDALENSRWGTIPGLNWPVSFAGLAYFVAMATAWTLCRGRLASPLRWLADLGAVMSLVFIGVMIARAQLCPYCAATHAANLSFTIVLHLTSLLSAVPHTEPPSMPRRSATRPVPPAPARPLALRRGPIAWAVAFALTTSGLAIGEHNYQADRAAQAEVDRAAFVKRAAENAAKNGHQQPTDRWGPAGLTGRYRTGPESAPIRIVVLTDYQCPDCNRIEGEIEQVLAARKDVSLSVKHFPMCTDCNKYAGRTLHPNACWAARAAEAAGILGGDEGFFKMHRWLFEVGGLFETQEQLNVGLNKLGFDPASFTPLMQSPETLHRVQADVEDGLALGLFFTPMIFINGVELKWTLDLANTVSRTVADLAARNLPAQTSAADRPVLAAQKYIDDWQQQPTRTLPPDQRSWTFAVGKAPEAAAAPKPVEIVLFGDYQESFTAAIDKDIRAALAALPASGSGARYTFRHYPVNKGCNPALPAVVPESAIHPLACRAALAAEAAGTLGGSDAYWRMHDWLLKNQADFNDNALKAAAAQLGLDAAALLAAMDKPEAAQAIAEDCRAAQQLGLTGVPMVFVNNRLVPRPQREGDNLMARILEVAAIEGK